MLLVLSFYFMSQHRPRDVNQGVCLAVAHSPLAIGNFGGPLEGMVAHCASGNKIDNIVAIRSFIIFCAI